jgi:hypothetical protein
MRYVILHHTGWIEDHFDLMLETDAESPLLTWRLDRWPTPTAITPLPPHRRVYLDYEGQVSNGRGQVRRVAQGCYQLLVRSDIEWRVRLDATSPDLVLPRPAGA